MPETASRWVRPEVRKSSVSSLRHAGVVTVDERGHQGSWTFGPGRDRRPDRVAQPVGAPAAAVPGGSSTSGGPRVLEHAGEVARARLLESPADAQGRAELEVGPALVGDDQHRRPHPVSAARDRPPPRCGRGRRRTARSAPGAAPGRRSPRRAPRRRPTAARAPRPAVACTASARSSAEAATPHPATIHAIRLSTARPRRRRCRGARRASTRAATEDPGRSAERGHRREPRDAARTGARRSTRSGSVTT